VRAPASPRVDPQGDCYRYQVDEKFHRILLHEKRELALGGWVSSWRFALMYVNSARANSCDSSHLRKCQSAMRVILNSHVTCRSAATGIFVSKFRVIRILDCRSDSGK
jgi:hypothetical protein